MPKDMPMEYTVVAYDFDAAAGNYSLSDLSEKPIAVPSKELIAARDRVAARKRKNRILTIKPGVALDDLNLAAAISQGIEACIDVMLHPEMTNFGLSSLDKWADLVVNSKDKKGWPNVFARDIDLYKALSQTYYWPELFGTGGGAARPMFADFLNEASAALKKPALKQVAGRYRELGRLWTEMCHFAFPFDEAKELMLRRKDVFRRKGGEAREEMAAIDVELKAMPARVDVSGMRRKLPELAERVREIAQAERDAIQTLQTIVS
jgi:hypothetical protein